MKPWKEHGLPCRLNKTFRTADERDLRQPNVRRRSRRPRSLEAATNHRQTGPVGRATIAEFTKPTNPLTPQRCVLGRSRFGYHNNTKLLDEVNDQLDDFETQETALQRPGAENVEETQRTAALPPDRPVKTNARTVSKPSLSRSLSRSDKTKKSWLLSRIDPPGRTTRRRRLQTEMPHQERLQQDS